MIDTARRYGVERELGFAWKVTVLRNISSLLHLSHVKAVLSCRSRGSRDQSYSSARNCGQLTSVLGHERRLNYPV